MILAVPGVARSEAGICIVSCVLLAKVVDRGLPFHRATAPALKFVPLIVNVNPGPPAVAEAGLRLLIVALRQAPACVSVNVRPARRIVPRRESVLGLVAAE